MINYRTFATLASTAIFKWLVSAGVIELTNQYVTADTLEAAIITSMLVLAAIFRKYAGQKLFGAK